MSATAPSSFYIYCDTNGVVAYSQRPEDDALRACEARIVRLVEDAARLRAKNRAFRGYDVQIREAEEALAKEGDRLLGLRVRTGGL